ncbi:MAG: hypothetical protein PHF84_00770 [bacterium]|nr:hypothetical protein [bacterium]
MLILYSNTAYGQALAIKDLGLKVKISLDREKYRIAEETFLNVEINNEENDAVHFYTSPYKLNNCKIEVLNLQQGEALEERYSKLVEKNNLKQEKPELFMNRETALYPDEVLKFKMNLQEYFEFPEPGRYKIQVVFDPFPGETQEHTVYLSNPLYLILDKSAVQKEYDDIVDRLKSLEDAKVYAPDSTIQYILDAYKRKDWNNYFLYQKLPNLILRYDPFKAQYLNASENMKGKVIADFKQWVMNQKEREIDQYEILEVFHAVKENKATVKCKVKYTKYSDFNTFYYLYTLRREGTKWFLEDVDVLSYSKEK